MPHGSGHRGVCPTCGQSVTHITDILSHRELRGPRNITSSNIDRLYDDGRTGRMLGIEEKNPGEPVPDGQNQALHALAVRFDDVWLVVGTPDDLTISESVEGGWTELGSGDWGYYQDSVLDWYRPY